jgi:hypothetical protein
VLRSDADGDVRGRRKNLSGEIAERELTEKTGEPDNCQIGSGLVQFIGSEAGVGDRPKRVIFAHSTSALAKKPRPNSRVTRCHLNLSIVCQQSAPYGPSRAAGMGSRKN